MHKYTNIIIIMTSYITILIPLILNSFTTEKLQLPKSEKILLFDIDNTLYPKSSGIDALFKQKINEYISKFDNTAVEKDLCTVYTKKYGLAIKGILLEHPKASIGEFYDFVEDTMDLEEYIEPDLELINLLKKLKDYKMYCFTNAHCLHALKVLKLLGIIRYMTGIFYCNYDITHPIVCKPDPTAYDLVDKALEGCEIFFYDDAPCNVEAGNKIGWNCTLIDNQLNIKDALKSFLENQTKPKNNDTESANPTNEVVVGGNQETPLSIGGEEIK